MCSDLFSQFDPAESILFSGVLVWLFWVMNFYLFFLLSVSFIFPWLSGYVWVIASSLVSFAKSFSSVGMWRFSGATNMLMSVFFLVLLINWVGLLPGTFSLSSHFLMSMSLSIPLWFSSLLMNFSKFPLVKLGWFIGTGVPVFLASPIGVCEIISSIMRPIALGLRLAANMLAGHVITSLVANCSIYTWSSMMLLAFLFYFFFSFGLFLFESAVCAIQAFVFTMLLQIYIQESPLH